MSSNKDAVPHTDPRVYDEYYEKWSELPQNEESWVKRAQDVAAVLAEDAGLRDRENKSPKAEVAEWIKILLLIKRKLINLQMNWKIII